MNTCPSLVLPVPVQVRASTKPKRSSLINCSALFWLFLFGSVTGVALEGVWWSVTRGWWEYHPATVVGPFCVIYGIGAIMIYTIAAWTDGESLGTQFILFSLAGALVEYLSSFFQELCFGSISWDYSGQFMNIGGRVSLRMTLLWGALGILFVQIIFPLLTRLLRRMRTRFWRVACVILAILMAVDLLVTVLAVARWSARLTYDNTPPKNQIECWMDEFFDDDTMQKRFPNMVFPSLA